METTPCRCCLLRPPDKDLKTPYVRVGVGIPEVYQNMLEQCFEIHVILGGEGECGICNVCVDRLRDASDFKLQVQRSQVELQARLAALLVKDEAEVKSETDEMMTSDDVSRPEAISEKENYGTSGDVIYGEPAVKSEPSADAAGDSGLPPGLEEWRLERLRGDAERRSCRAGPRTYTYTYTREPSDCTDTASNIYQCDQCGKGFGNKSRLRKHVHTHLPGPSAYSNKRLETPSVKHSPASLADRVQADQMVHTRDKPFQCSYCDFKCNWKSSLERHKRIHTREKPYKCSHCDYKGNEKAHLERHKRIHTGEKPFQCSFCDYKSNDGSHLERHKRIHTGEKPFQCSFCDYKSNERSHLERHKRIHTGEKPYKCSHCDYRYSDKSSLDRHKRIHTGEKPFLCSFCDYKCSLKSNLNLHKRIHTGEKPYKCSHCDYRCSDKSSLDRHKRIHTGEKPFQCSFCDYKCSMKSNLNLHERIHTGQKPFQCSYCDYKCSLKSNLKNHERIHTGEKPFQCSFCDYKCSQKSNLKNHERIHTRERNLINVTATAQLDINIPDKDT